MSGAAGTCWSRASPTRGTASSTWRRDRTLTLTVSRRRERGMSARDEAAGGRFDPAELLDLVQEDGDDLRVELGAHAAFQLAAGDLVGQGLAVRAVGGHRVVGVGDGDDAADERDVIALESL